MLRRAFALAALICTGALAPAAYGGSVLTAHPVTSFPSQCLQASGAGTIADSAGNFWSVCGARTQHYSVVRVTPGGSVSVFPFSRAGATDTLYYDAPPIESPAGLVFKTNRRVIRVTPSGHVEVLATIGTHKPRIWSIAPGAGASVWYSALENGKNFAAHVTPAGEDAKFFFADGMSGWTTLGPAAHDGSVWFNTLSAVVGQLSPAGEMTSRIQLPSGNNKSCYLDAGGNLIVATNHNGFLRVSPDAVTPLPWRFKRRVYCPLSAPDGTFWNASPGAVHRFPLDLNRFTLDDQVTSFTEPLRFRGGGLPGPLHSFWITPLSRSGDPLVRADPAGHFFGYKLRSSDGRRLDGLVELIDAKASAVLWLRAVFPRRGAPAVRLYRIRVAAGDTGRLVH